MPRTIPLAAQSLALLLPLSPAGTSQRAELDPAWRAAAAALVAPEVHAFVADDDGGARASSPGHGFTARLGASGVAVEHERGSLTLSLSRFGRGEELGGLPVASFTLGPERAELDHGLLVEWWTNGAAGMEQGFDVPRPPASGSAGPLVLELALGGTLGPRLENEGRALDFHADGRAVLRYSKLVAFDADGALLAARMTLADGALRLEIDDEGARYPLAIDPLLGVPSWTNESKDDFAWFGYSVATAGDVNGDGYSDVLVGAPTHDRPGVPWAGAAFLYLGSANGLGTGWSWRAFGDVTQTEFGYAVAGAGDVNGDGYDDVLVSQPRAASEAGRVHLYLGNATGANLVLAWTRTGDAPAGRFGFSLAYAGDVNADGFADVVIGSPFRDLMSIDRAGRADLFLGSPQGLPSTPSWSVLGDQEDADLGFCVATAGDVNGDGHDDVIVGEPGRSNGGRALIFAGGAGGLGASAAWSYSPGVTPSDLGWSVATAGDVNRDGYADVVVGSPLRTTPAGAQAGVTLVFHGSANWPGSQHDWWHQGPSAFETSGECVAPAGDVDGDGYADLLIGAPGFGNPTVIGSARIFHGSPSGLATTFGGSTSGVTSYGSSLATAGDVNGDGYSDVIVGEPWFGNGQSNEGSARVYHGRAGTPTAGDDAVGPQNASGFGYSLANAGDVDGDGYSDVIVGAPRADVMATDGGYLRLCRGRADLALVTSWELHGASANALLGISVASAGDVNGDGFDDVIAGARGASNGELEEGAAFIFHGSAQGLGATWDTRLELDLAGAGFGNSVASAGDVDGDGFADVIVGAPFAGTNGSANGRAYVFRGGVHGIDPVPVWSYDGAAAQSWFGHAVSGAGDVDADGYSDVIIGAPFWSSGGAVFAGYAQLFRGSAQGLEAAPAWTTPLGNANWTTGYAVSSAGDVNGDGYADVLVGAPGQNPGNNGRALVFHGSPTGLSPFWNTLLMPSGSNGQLGWSVAAAGDLDGDGFGDVIVGAPFAAAGQGRAQVHFGSSSGLPAGASLLTDGAMQWGNLRGIGVGGGGDHDGDGFADLLVGAPDVWQGGPDPGHIGVVAGNTSTVGLALRPRHAAQRQLAGGARIALRGRAKVPGTVALEVHAHSPAGRARVQLEWQLARRGETFAGQAVHHGAWTDTGAPNGLESAVTLSELDDQLLYDEIYTWRARVTSRNPLFPHGPWLSAAGNSPTEGKLSTRVGQSAAFAGARKQNP